MREVRLEVVEPRMQAGRLTGDETRPDVLEWREPDELLEALEPFLVACPAPAEASGQPRRRN